MEGTIKSLVRDKGYGFIINSARQEFFFHRTSLRNCRYEDLHEGQEVTFEDSVGDKGSRAEDVFLTSGQ